MRATEDEPTGDADGDDRPPICPACGVTMGIVVDGDEAEHVCLECGYAHGDKGRADRRGAGPDA